MIKGHRNIHTCYIDVIFLVLILHNGYLRCNHWRKLCEEYTGPFSIIFVTSH